MKRTGRYDTSDLIENQYEPGSRGRVLRNRRGIKSKREMDQIEGQSQVRALDRLVRLYDSQHQFTAADICQIHREWLGDIYHWAGHYRQVNLGKDDFTFAAARWIPKLMAEFESGSLASNTPCRNMKLREVVQALAQVHTELLLIHPFRDGNGRMARLLAILMALQADLPVLDFSNIKGRKREEYFAAVRSGINADYGPMERIFEIVVEETLSRYEKRSPPPASKKP